MSSVDDPFQFGRDNLRALPARVTGRRSRIIL
jgi:hypothetical protein